MTNTAPDPVALPPRESATENLSPETDAANEWVDEALAPFQFFLGALAATTEPFGDESVGVRTLIDALRVSLPFEMDVLVDDAGRVHLAGGPPAYYTETSVMPVFHQLSLRVESETLDG